MQRTEVFFNSDNNAYIPIYLLEFCEWPPDFSRLVQHLQRTAQRVNRWRQFASSVCYGVRVLVRDDLPAAGSGDQCGSPWHVDVTEAADIDNTLREDILTLARVPASSGGVQPTRARSCSHHLNAIRAVRVRPLQIGSYIFMPEWHIVAR